MRQTIKLRSVSRKASMKNRVRMTKVALQTCQPHVAEDMSNSSSQRDNSSKKKGVAKKDDKKNKKKPRETSS